MVPCPSCQNLCGVKSAIVSGDRLSYRCSRCSLGFDVADALRGQIVDPEASTPVLALKPRLPNRLKVEKVVFDDVSTAEVTMDLSGAPIEREAQVLYVLDDEQGYRIDIDDAYVDDVLEAAFDDVSIEEEPAKPSPLPIFAKPKAVLEIPKGTDSTPKTDRSNSGMALLPPLAPTSPRVTLAPASPRVTLFPPMVKQFVLPLSEVLDPTSKWEPKPKAPKPPTPKAARNSHSRPPTGRKSVHAATPMAKAAIVRHVAAIGAVLGLAALTAMVARSVALDDDGVRVSSAMVTHAEVPNRLAASKPVSVASAQSAQPTAPVTAPLLSADDEIEIFAPELPAPLPPVAKSPTKNVALAFPAQPPRSKARVTEVETMTVEADLAYRAGDFARAGSLYRDALAISPRFIPARLGAAAVEWDTGRREQARAHYRALVADAPSLAPPIARERAR